MKQPFSGTVEWVFMKLLPNDTGKMEFPTRLTQMGARPQIIFGGQ